MDCIKEDKGEIQTYTVKTAHGYTGEETFLIPPLKKPFELQPMTAGQNHSTLPVCMYPFGNRKRSSCFSKE